MNDLKYVRAAALAAILAGAGALSACFSSPVEPTTDFALTSLSETEDATATDVQAESTWVIRDQDQFQRIWDRFFARRFDRPMPTIDFTTQMVVVVTMGPQPTAGYAVRITRVSRNERGIVVHVTTSSPGPNCTVAQVRTLPTAFSRLRKTDRPVHFEFTRTTRDCTAQ